VLGVRRDASADEVKAAYRRLVVSYSSAKASELPASQTHHAYPSPTRGMVGEVLGEAQGQAHLEGGTHPALLKSTKQALRS